MKIRIKGNSVRFRLTRSDLSKLDSQHAIIETTEFMSNTFLYEIHVAEFDALAADLVDCHMILQLPRLMLNELVESDKVGFTGNSGLITLLIEKDFTCLENVEEDQSDNFPNPLLEQNK